MLCKSGYNNVAVDSEPAVSNPLLTILKSNIQVTSADSAKPKLLGQNLRLYGPNLWYYFKSKLFVESNAQ